MGLFGGLGTAIGSYFGGPIGGAIGGALGGAIDTSDARSAANQTNDQNIAIARENRQWQEQMSNTAHQREVTDLKAAGLNPMLSGMGGSGAVTPVPQLAKVENSAASAAKTTADSSVAALTRAQIQTAESQTLLNSATAAKVQQETRSASANADVAQLDAGRAAKLNDDKFGVEKKEFAARFADAVTKQFERSNDWNSLSVLNDLARQKGYANYSVAMKDTAFQQAVTELYQSKLKNSEFEAYSNMYHSDYGKNIAPYVSSASGIAGAASGAVGAASAAVRAAKMVSRGAK